MLKNSMQILVDYGDDKNKEIKARLVKTREMPWILSTLPPITTLRSTTSSSNVLAADGSEKIKTSTRRHPSSPLWSEIFSSGRYSTTSSTTTSPGIETPEELFIQSGPGNECERKCYSTAQFVDSSRYTKRYSRKAISPLFPHHFIPFSSIQQVGPALGNERVESRVAD